MSKDPRRHTPVFRGSYVNIDKPRKANEEAEPLYSIMIVLDPEDSEQADYINTLEDWVNEVAEAKFGEVPRRLKSPIREGELVADEFIGYVCINASSNRRPGVVDADLNPLDEMDLSDEVYSGAWYRASIRPYAWEHKTGGKGVSFGLDNLMKVEDDEPLGNVAPKPEDDFAEMKSAGRKKARSRAR
jgi:Enterobacter phage Enc34, ssDNA-binding protein